MNIAFLTTGHSAYDDRIYYHLAATLAEAGHKVLIVSSRSDEESEKGGITVRSFRGKDLPVSAKRSLFIKYLMPFAPDRIICSEPLALFTAVRYKRNFNTKLKIFYDITEWYPSLRFLGEYRSGLKWFGFIRLLAANFIASLLSDAFIFGEKLKSRPYRFFFPLKPFAFITYYPDLRYINESPPLLTRGKIRLSFSGDSGKGLINFLEVVYRLAEKYPERNTEVKIIGCSDSERAFSSISRKNPENIKFKFIEAAGYQDYIELIKESDIFLELRNKNFENNNSLPIKLFLYAALGRPVIISDLRSLREYTEIRSFCHATDPADYDRIISLLSEYLNDNSLYYEHCHIARQFAVEKYNWNVLAPRLLRFIQEI